LEYDVKNIVRHISSPNFEEYFETLLISMPWTTDSVIHGIYNDSITENPQDQENTQRADIEDTSSSRKRKRNMEDNPLPNTSIESRVARSFYSNINEIVRKNKDN
jgi:hypothetical protein